MIEVRYRDGEFYESVRYPDVPYTDHYRHLRIPPPRKEERVIVWLPALHAEAEEWDKVCRSQGWPTGWHPEQLSPRPEWHAREAILLGSGVIQFPGEKTYYCIKAEHLRRLG